MTGAWRVVETRYDDQGRVAATVEHTTIGSAPMTEHDAKTVATQQMGRHAASFPKRTFRAEPVPVRALASLGADLRHANAGDYFAEDFRTPDDDTRGGA